LDIFTHTPRRHHQLQSAGSGPPYAAGHSSSWRVATLHADLRRRTSLQDRKV